MPAKEKIFDWVKKNRERIMEFVQQLVKTPSTPGNEAQAQEIVREKFLEMGLEVDVWEPDPEELRKSPDWVSAYSDYTGRPNVVGVWRGEGGGRSLILNGHIDVVPPDPLEDWTRDPWSGQVEDGYLYGRGTSDMKGGLGAVIMAVQGLQEIGHRTGGDVLIESVVDEERGGNGTLACCLRGYSAAGAVIPEPTGMEVCPVSRGSVWFNARVFGRQAHSGTAYEGVSAIELSCEIIRELKKMETERNEVLRASEPLFRNHPLPIPLFVGKGSGGIAPNVIPDRFLLEGILSVSPNETMEEAKTALRKRLAAFDAVHGQLGISPLELDFSSVHYGPARIPADHPIVGTAVKALEAADIHPVVKGFPSGCDVRHLIRLAGTPAIVFGPGDLNVAHRPDERVSLEEIESFVRVMMVFIKDWCR